MLEAAFGLLSAPQEAQPETPPGAAADVREPDNNLDQGHSLSDERKVAMTCAFAAYNTTRPLFAWAAGRPGHYTKNIALEAGLRSVGGAIGQALGEWSCNASLGNGAYAGKDSVLLAGGTSGLEVVLHNGTTPAEVAKKRDEARAFLNAWHGQGSYPATPYRIHMPSDPIAVPRGWVSALENYAPAGVTGSVGVVLVADHEKAVRQTAEQNRAVRQLSQAFANPDADLNLVFAEVRNGETLNRVIERLLGDALSEPPDAAAFRARLNLTEQARFDLSIKTIDTVGVDGLGPRD